MPDLHRMNAVRSRPLDARWKERLDLTARTAPELYEDAAAVTDTPHAGAIRTTFRELRASAVFCVQHVPTVVILSVDDYDRKAIVDLHAKLWNQGLANLLLVLSGDTVRAFSLARIPHPPEDEDFDDRCLAWELDAAARALEVNNLIYGAESGRLWEHAKFKPEERIDRVLLDNLKVSHTRLLHSGMTSAAAQALLIQSMFIAYLEDRQIISAGYLSEATDRRAARFVEILDSGNATALDLLFKRLRNDFNGDLFVAPCSFSETDPHPPPEPADMAILSRFRSGDQEMDSGQYRFWGYDFKYIPVELISAVYDRFLGELKSEQRRRGAYYTPRFVVDMTISQIADRLPSEKLSELRFLDPACGSGIFLVRCFQYLCEHRRMTKGSARIPWNSLRAMISRLEGWDIDDAAVRVAVFSLYVALLEEVEPPDIQALIKRGNLLPRLWDRNMRTRDFFTVDPREENAQADVIIGNPPWSSRRQPDRRSIEWCKTERLPMPGGEEAWAFVWKSLRHLRPDGVIAFLLPAMGFLHNHAGSAVKARLRLLRDARIFRVVNLADLRFQLFESAVRPSALIVFGHADPDGAPYWLEYLTPKADLNLKNRRLITLSSADKHSLVSPNVESDPSVFKRRLWISGPEERLFRYLSRFSRLGDTVSVFRTGRGVNGSNERPWMIGQGFKPYRSGKPITSPRIAQIPYLPIERFTPFLQGADRQPWVSSTVHRKGFEQGFTGPRVLVPRGVSHRGIAHTRLRAAYIEASATFQDIIQAIVVPFGAEDRAKLLTALINSRIAVWYAFHGTSSFGAERPEVKQAELLRLPFPAPDEIPDEDRSRSAEKGMISLIDDMMRSPVVYITESIFEKIDRLAYDFFGLTDEEIVLVEDTVEHTIPAVHPTRNSVPGLWQGCTPEDRRGYAHYLVRRMSHCLEDGYTVEARLEAHNEDLAILRLTLRPEHEAHEYRELESRRVHGVLSKLAAHMPRHIGNFQLMPDFRLFSGDHLYLVKPTQKRFWLRSVGIADADDIALDLQLAAERRESKGLKDAR